MHSSDQLSFALATAHRTMISGINLPYNTVKIAWEESAYTPLHNKLQDISSEARIAVLSWGELAGSVAAKVYDRDLFQVDAGITLKYLMGTAGGYMQQQGTLYHMPQNYFLVADELNMDVAHAYSGSPLSLSPLGHGIGGDLGFTFMRKKYHKAPYYGCPSIIDKSHVGRLYVYKWKLGISLLDLGMIRFTESSKLFGYRKVRGLWDSINTMEVKSVEDFDRELNTHWYHSTSDNKFNMWLPLAASFQFDYFWKKNIFFNLGMMQRINFPGLVGPVRMTSITFTPRYETDDFEIAIPVSFVEYQALYSGLMLRYKYFFAGTEQLGSMTGLSRLNGMSFYFGFRIYQLKSARLQSQPFLGF
jgi:hypothetical protein